MPTWLAFDAGSPVTSAAVARDGVLLAGSSGESRSGPSLLRQIDDCLGQAAVATGELDAIVVLRGPGSFTGIRVALATALGFRAALAAPVHALSNLAALALHSRPEEAAPILALVDALRGEWFVQRFHRDRRGLIADSAPERVAAAAIVPPRDAVLAGHLSQLLPERLAGMALLRADELASPVAIAASSGQLAGELSGELEPLYLRGFTPRDKQT